MVINMRKHRSRGFRLALGLRYRCLFNGRDITDDNVVFVDGRRGIVRQLAVDASGSLLLDEAGAGAALSERRGRVRLVRRQPPPRPLWVSDGRGGT